MTEHKIEDLKEEDFKPKWYLNGFPKSGLHWLALMMMPIAEPLFEDHNLWNIPWAGTFAGNSWTNNNVPLGRVTYKIGRLRDGYFFKGHSAYTEDLDKFLWYLGASTIFIYRDLRDVAVSQAFHVLNENDDLVAHPDKKLYMDMDSFDDVLRAVIVGVTAEDETEYPGVVDRWEHYAGWLDCDWVCKIKFEDLVEDTHAVAKKMLRHGLQRTSSIFGLKPTINEENFSTVADWMVTAGNKKEKSPTFRKGVTGDWRNHFTDEHRELFRETGGDGWLEKLGYS